MITLRYQEGCAPHYMTAMSSGADLRARESILIPAREVRRVPTGVWIAAVDTAAIPPGTIPELQVRARSGLAFKHGVTLANGVGTVDADYPDEIGVLLMNTGSTAFQVEVGDRVAQLVLALAYRIPELPIGAERKGGFGSTG